MQRGRSDLEFALETNMNCSAGEITIEKHRVTLGNVSGKILLIIVVVYELINITYLIILPHELMSK